MNLLLKVTAISVLLAYKLFLAVELCKTLQALTLMLKAQL